MFSPISNVIDSTPDYVVGFDGGQYVLVRVDARPGGGSGFKTTTVQTNGTGTLTAMVASPLSRILGSQWTTPSGQQFIVALSAVDGVTQYWKPLGGRQMLYCRAQSLATPLASVTPTGVSGSAAGQFTIPNGTTIPANLLLPGVSTLRVCAHFRRTTATLQGNIDLRFGTSNNNSDSLIETQVLAATIGQDYRVDLTMGLSTPGRVTSVGTTAPNGQGTTTAADATTNIAATSAMALSAQVSAADNTDTYQLISLSIELLG